MLSVAGIDLGGRRCRVCLLDPMFPDKPVVWGFEPDDMKQLSHVEAVRRAGVWARLHFRSMTAEHLQVVYVERPFGRFPEVNFQLSLMAGALIAAVPPDAAVEFVEASWCRALVGLSARAKKETIIKWALAETGLELDEHSSDALVCARAVLAFGSKEGVAS